MSTVTPPDSTAKATPDRPASSPQSYTSGSQVFIRRRLRARATVVATLIVGLVLTGVAREWALGLQTKAYLAGPYADTSNPEINQSAAVMSAGSLDSYFLVLMLGGLRGPLVMYLWSSSENQKNEKDLEDFNTKVNLIRLLQPEFISVHIFQSWNLAYNISVQLASLSDRYSTILHAVDYANQVARSRRNDVNVLLMLNQLFQQKLGQTAADSIYYRVQVRKDSKWRQIDTSQGVGTLSQRMPPILGKDDLLQPQLLGVDSSGKALNGIVAAPADSKARVYVPVDRLAEFRKAAESVGVTLPALAPSPFERELIVSMLESDARKVQTVFNPVDVAYIFTDWNDGSELQYLRPYGPYTYGVSPLAIGFNYGKRAQVLINRTKQKPSQYSSSVVDSRPAIELRDWGKEERERATVAEARAFGRQDFSRKFLEWAQSSPVVDVAPEKSEPLGPGVRAPETKHSGLNLPDLVSRYLANPGVKAPPHQPMDRIDDAVFDRLGGFLASVTHPNSPGTPADVQEALFGYRQSARLLQDARSEFIRHINNPEEGIRRLQDFTSQIDELSPDQLLAEGDHDFLLAQQSEEVRKSQPGLYGQPRITGRAELLARAADKYRKAIEWVHYINLRYYLPREVTQLILPPARGENAYQRALWAAAEQGRNGVARMHLSRLSFYNMMEPGPIPMPPMPPREGVDQLAADPARLEGYYQRGLQLTAEASKYDMNRDNRLENEPAEIRASMRLKEIDRMLSGQPASQPVIPATQSTSR